MNKDPHRIVNINIPLSLKGLIYDELESEARERGVTVQDIIYPLIKYHCLKRIAKRIDARSAEDRIAPRYMTVIWELPE